MTKNNIRVGDTITTAAPLPCRYYNYPAGRNRHILPTGSVAVVKSVPAKVRIAKGAGKDSCSHFLNVDAGGITYAANFCQVRRY